MRGYFSKTLREDTLEICILVKLGSPILKEEYRLRMFEDKMLMRIFGPNRKGETR
jgi:hypothetical protein